MKMKPYHWFNLLAALLILAACTPSSPIFGPSDPTPTLPSAQVTITSVPDAQAAMSVFLEAFKIEDYAAMYGMLSKVSQDTVKDRKSVV